MRRFVRAEAGGNGPRVGRIDGAAVAMLDHDDPLAALAGRGEVTGHWDLAGLALLAPINAPEIWCAGVTYERSRDARLEEAQTEARDVYALVYDADRPELVPNIVRKASAALQEGGFRVSVVDQKAPPVVGIIGRR